MTGHKMADAAPPLTLSELDDRLRLRLRIDALMADYVHCVDDDRLEEWHTFFTADGLYRVITRENRALGLPVSLIYCAGHGMLKDRIIAMRTANIYEPHVYCHAISALRITSVGGVGGEIGCESTFTVVRTMADGTMVVFACGKVIDRIAEDGGTLRFKERLVVLDSRRIDTLLVMPI